MKQTLKIILASALGTAALIKGVPALAEPAAANVTVSVVRTADLDLQSNVGREELDHRLVIAAHAVCDTVSAVDLKARNAQADCREQVLAAAREKVRGILAGRDPQTALSVAVRD